MRHYKFRRKSQEYFGFSGAYAYAYNRLTKNSENSRKILLLFLGLEFFDSNLPAPEGFRRSGCKLIDKISKEKFTLFSFGELNRARSSSLTNFFRLAVLVCGWPRKNEKFYIHNLDKNVFSKNSKRTSEKFTKTHLEKFKKKRAELIFEKKIDKSKAEFSVLQNAVILLAHLAVRESSDHPFIPKPNTIKFKNYIEEIKNEF